MSGTFLYSNSNLIEWIQRFVMKNHRVNFVAIKFFQFVIFRHCSDSHIDRHRMPSSWFTEVSIHICSYANATWTPHSNWSEVHQENRGNRSQSTSWHQRRRRRFSTRIDSVSGVWRQSANNGNGMLSMQNGFADMHSNWTTHCKRKSCSMSRMRFSVL